MAGGGFLNSLKEYKLDEVNEKILTKVKAIISKPDFDVVKIAASSKAAGGMARWCKAVMEYAEAVKIVRPKEEHLR